MNGFNKTQVGKNKMLVEPVLKLLSEVLLIQINKDN